GTCLSDYARGRVDLVPVGMHCLVRYARLPGRFAVGLRAEPGGLARPSAGLQRRHDLRVGAAEVDRLEVRRVDYLAGPPVHPAAVALGVEEVDAHGIAVRHDHVDRHLAGLELTVEGA